MIRTRLGRRSIASALSITVVVAACSSGSDSESDQTIAATASPTTSVETPDHKADDRRDAPARGDAAPRPDPERRQCRPSVKSMPPAACSVDDVPIEWAEEGDTAESGADAVQTLLDEHVDAIIGPASSMIALSALTSIVSNGVLACSPTASALALTTFPTTTCSSAPCRATRCRRRRSSQVADGTGFPSVAIVYVDDGLRATVVRLLSPTPSPRADRRGRLDPVRQR